MSGPRWLTFANVGVVLAIIGVAYQLFVKDRKISRAITYNRFVELGIWRHDHINFFQPKVGIIQFLNSGYSVTLDSVTYENDGLRLTGTIGNPKSIEVSTLTLRFDAYRPIDDLEKSFLHNPDDWSSLINDSIHVTSAEVAVGDLWAGSTAHFSVLLPTLKPTESKYELAVSFTGERYEYLLR